MSDAEQAATADGKCGKWMPRAKTYCAREAGHVSPCATPEVMEKQRVYSRGRERVVTPEAKARWSRTHKFVRLGVTEEWFNELLKLQGGACAMCRKPFGDEFPQVDHDHSCCERQVKATAKTCGKCIRGLLCFRCNTALGYVERYEDVAREYRADPPAARLRES